MGLLWKFLRGLPGGATVLLMFFAGVGPQEAASHLSEWLKLVGIEKIPSWLANKSTDQWAFLIGLIGFVAWVLIIWLRPWLKQARITAPSEWRGYLPWGILWDFEGFLGANRKDGVTHVACFQIKGVNRTKRFIQLKSAHIVSCITSRQIPVHMRTDSGYAPPNEANPIPREARFRMQGLFYDPNSIKAGDREGIREDEFLRDFSEFIFETEYDGRRFTKTFNAANISAELNRLKPEQLSTPRVTKKATTPPALDNPLPKKRAFVDEGKIRLIDDAFKHIRSQCLPQYDRYCDSTIGPWKHMLLESSRKQFSENAWANIQESSSRVNELITILNENKIYKDVYDELIGIGEQHNHVIEKFRDFEEKVKRFPERATANLLELVENEGFEMCKIVGKYGEWLRNKSDVLVKMRAEEMQLGQ